MFYVQDMCYPFRMNNVQAGEYGVVNETNIPSTRLLPLAPFHISKKGKINTIEGNGEWGKNVDKNKARWEYIRMFSNTGFKEVTRVFTYCKAFVTQVFLQCNRGCDARRSSNTANELITDK